jgi:probable O-glycosylation ligase (exosortase A-associated)
MRDALLMVVVLAGLFAALRYPFAGVILWAWFSLMTPHQLAYGVYGVPLNMVIAGVTIISLLMHGEFRKFRLDAIALCLIALSAWLAISQAFSLDPQNSAVYFDRFIKTLAFALICTLSVNSRLKAHALVLMLVIGIGFFAAKGALFTLVTLGQYHVQGIALTILEDNNHLGIAMACVLPMMVYVRSVSARPIVRHAMTALAILTVIAIVGTQSRGAFISLVVFVGYFWVRSRHKFAFIAAAALFAIPTIAFMPTQWQERMATITAAGEDESFMGRVHAWEINWKFALANPVTGAGLRNPYQPELAKKVDPVLATDAKAAHSIYFEMLGGAGFVGLGLYLCLLGAAFFKARSLSKQTEPEWVRRFGYFTQIALAVFFVGGASTSMEMWDGYLILIALTGAVGKLAAADAVAPRAVERELTARCWRARPAKAPLCGVPDTDQCPAP